MYVLTTNDFYPTMWDAINWLYIINLQQILKAKVCVLETNASDELYIKIKLSRE